jgi:hypothetical protein
MKHDTFYRIINKALLENQWHYQIQWVDPKKSPTWISASHLANHAELVYCFEFLSSARTCFGRCSGDESQKSIPATSITLIEACLEEKECKIPTRNTFLDGVESY